MNNDEIIFAIIKKSKKNLTAYEILDKVQKTKKVQPMTIYRSLKNLTDKGLYNLLSSVYADYDDSTKIPR
jgi:Fe2+ or Zn2+ uptake regulation protein